MLQTFKYVILVDGKVKEQQSIFMFIKYSLREQILIPAEEYTASPTKSTRNALFSKYLFKIIKIGGINNSKSSQAICVKIQAIQIIDNIILRKSADMKVKVLITLIALRLIPNQYFEGKVVRVNAKGIIVSFLGGLLEGTINIKYMHKDTIYNQENNKWILATGQDNSQGYEWKVGADVRFRVAYTLLEHQQEEQQSQGLQMCDLIYLKADEAGLGPVQWWL